MAVREGACRFDLWYVQVNWEGSTVYRVRFMKSGQEAPVPSAILRYLAGRTRGIPGLSSIATKGSSVYAAIYREVSLVPYGTTCTYGEVAARVGTSPRTVGQAMARNPTPLIIPCHRIVASRGLGGFTPSVELKMALLEIEGTRKKEM
ncbi:MAG: MGMT family protein [Methanomicrobiales archaeon]|nr:MGMT family protein [Methanomicrobiales archaeon]